ncbi:hypothetical protein BD414DRAFT_510471 [Trametes punicea]|nr:hypothetical protein BD414DRAFT_510471 [Trametes punicea]
MPSHHSIRYAAVRMTSERQSGSGRPKHALQSPALLRLANLLATDSSPNRLGYSLYGASDIEIQSIQTPSLYPSLYTGSIEYHAVTGSGFWKISGASIFVYDSQNGFYSFLCNSTPPEVPFNWGGKNWSVSTVNFDLDAVHRHDRSLRSFLKNVYAAFSFDANSVGFATLR